MTLLTFKQCIQHVCVLSTEEEIGGERKERRNGQQMEYGC